RPLEVVEQRPVEVAAHVEAVGDALLDAPERARDELAAACVVVAAEAVLGHEDRQAGRLGRSPDRVTEGLGLEEITHLRALGVDAGVDRPAGPDAHARVGLDADEVTLETLEKLVFGGGAPPGHGLLAARRGLPRGHHDRQPDARLRTHALDRLDRPAVRRAHDLGGPGTVRVLEQDDPILRRRRRLGDAQHAVQQAAEVRLVERAGIRDEIAEVTHGVLAEAGETVGRLRTLPAPARRDPARRGEVVERQHRRQPVLVTRIQHSPVVLERGSRELALLGFDARPLERAAVGAEPESGHERDVARVAVVVIAGIARHLGVGRGRQVLHEPAVVVDVAALDLVGRGRRAPQEPAGKAHAAPAGRRFAKTCAASPVSAMIAAAAASGAAVSMWIASRAPISAPTSIAPTARMRRPIRESAPPASAESAAIPVSVIVRTVVVSSATASLRAVEFWIPMARASTAIRTKRVTSAAARTVAART